MYIPKNTSKFLGELNYKTIERNEIENLFRFIMTSKKYSLNISLYDENKIDIRDIMESNKDGENVYLDQDILFLKLAKLGLVNIDFYKAQLDIKTKEGLDFYKFLKDYIIPGENYIDNETGKTRYHLDEILKNKYEELIQHIILNIFPGDKIPKYVDEVNFGNRLLMKVDIENLKLFFESVNKLFIKQNTINKIQEKIIQEYNSNKSYIEFRIGDYFKGYASSYELIKYLEKNGILSVSDVRLYYKDKYVNRRIKRDGIYQDIPNMRLGYLMIRFELKKYIEELLPEFLEGFTLSKKIDKTALKLQNNGNLYYGEEFINFPLENLSYILLKEVLE